MKNNTYSLENNILTIGTECGDFKFKVDPETEKTKARQIAELMVAEMAKVADLVRDGREKTSPYARLLMSNLNLSDKYVRLENKYNQLVHEMERLKAEQNRPYGFRPAARTTAVPPPEPVVSKAPPAPETHRVVPSAVETPPPVPSVKPAPPELETTAPESVPQAPAVENDAPSPVADKRTEAPAEEPFSEAQVVETEATEPESSPVESKPEPIATPSESAQPTQLVKQVLATLKQSEPAAPLEQDAQDQPPEVKGPSVEGAATVEESGVEEDEPTLGGNGVAAPAPPPLKIKERVSWQPPPQLRARGSGSFQLPALEFLKEADVELAVDHEAIRRDAELLEQKLGYFGIKGEVMEVSPGPVITTFEYRPAPGIKISKIVNLADDLALALSALSIRIVAPIPGKDVIGIEIPNPQMSIVPFIDIVGSETFADIESPIPICLGKDIIGNPVVVGLEKMPHLLIAGATGTGKSVALNAMITSILYKSRPDEVKFIMIDPKRIELSLFNDVPHLLTPVITDMKKANVALQWVVREMEARYEKLATLQVRNIDQYNEKIRTADLSAYDPEEEFKPFPYIVVIIDELADLMMTASKDIEFSLTRIAQMARAAGIHLILATQRPSVDVLTGIIKANFPTRVSFQVSSKTDSRTIIDANGAETLLGRGDMLFVPPGTARLTRVHGTYLSEDELVQITDFIKTQGKPNYVLEVVTEREEAPGSMDPEEDEYDEKYQAALAFVLSSRQASISSVQRALRVGYNRAARIIDLMEKRGIVSASDGVKPRQVLVDRIEP